MRNGTCPECNSTEVYFASGADSQGLRDEHTVYLAIRGLNATDLETYVCTNCGYIRSFASEKDLAQIRAGIGKSQPWKKVR